MLVNGVQVTGLPKTYQETIDRLSLLGFRGCFYVRADLRVDLNGCVMLKDGLLVDGGMPIKFGVVNGSFTLQNCSSLKILKSPPEAILRDFHIEGCDNLEEIDKLPNVIFGKLHLDNISPVTGLASVGRICLKGICTKTSEIDSIVNDILLTQPTSKARVREIQLKLMEGGHKDWSKVRKYTD